MSRALPSALFCFTMALIALPATAQTPLLEIDYNSATVFHVLSDGKLLMPIGANAGYILTTDAQGNAAWMPPPAGSFALPYLGSTASSSAAFSVENTGTGRGIESTAQATALQVSSALQEGVRVSQAGTRGVFVASSGSEAFGAQFAGGDGVSIFQAGNPSMTIGSSLNNGFEVAGAEHYGVYVGRAEAEGVRVESAGRNGVWVESAGDAGVFISSAIFGVRVQSVGGNGVWVESAGDAGVHVESVGNPSTKTNSLLENGFEVSGAEGHGLFVGQADEDGVHVNAVGGRAGYFNGDVEVIGMLTKGSGTFKIDHPLDPENRYLSHSFVESPDMMNVYNGTIITDEEGFAIVELPAYFEALNRDFRYQLTVIGTFAQAIVAEEISGNRFVIQTDQPAVKVSWQVTGIRQDPYAEHNRVVVEEDKPPQEQGYYLHPEAYGQPRARSISYIETIAPTPTNTSNKPETLNPKPRTHITPGRGS